MKKLKRNLQAFNQAFLRKIKLSLKIRFNKINILFIKMLVKSKNENKKIQIIANKFRFRISIKMKMFQKKKTK
jgi:hypothetical protein